MIPTLRILATLALTWMIIACEKPAPNTNLFSDVVMQKIADLQDRRLADSLYPFLQNANPAYRRQAALAFASLQDSLAVQYLGKVLMRDNDSLVRAAAAFALGQTPSSETERLLLGAVIKERSPSVMREVLEAYGKTTSRWEPLNPRSCPDSVRSEGTAWSIYRAGLRGATDSVANRIAATLIAPSNPLSTRLAAAHYFSRPAKSIEKQFNAIKLAAMGDASIDVRMAAILALRKIPTDESLGLIAKVLSQKIDYRVRINAIRALQGFDFEKTKGLLFDAITDKNVNVAIAASEVIRDQASHDYWIEIANLTARARHWRVLANIHEASVRAIKNEDVAEEIMDACKHSTNPYEKAALITALQTYLPAFGFIREEFIRADTPVVRSAAASALAKMNYEKDFSIENKREFVAVVRLAVSNGDPASIGTLAGTLADESLDYKKVVTEYSFLTEARSKLSLPRDIEAVAPLEKAIAYFNGTQAKEPQKVYNHPIDWDLVRTIPSDQIVLIRTSRGRIKIRLLVEEAPGSVANFVKLARAGYFNGKPFHRVVPNFVVQGGCRRGDGSGSEDYSIRSEFSRRRYTTGSVGMASSGKDTEGTQWFITHSPTPHLDGRYTIFGEVLEGMDVVNLLEVGDRILSVKIP